ncbi:hypothetical protein Poli38472_011754 [Pythium oligandrum]|uniref:Uncharacterized protein n=1 Tax=Pythium oligandrum TaxID=41045 RepID=A0A8K1C857_PYTOL|nr:hypothetical protein Poli38472_011754 [Pythium oligandrum]|eukprot:TMW58166.1 hypothetical protein Poli38472_011754 [Pythium oligandrum]
MYVLASVVGFPLPFGQIVGSVAGFPTVLVSLRVLWRNAIRQDSKLRADVHQQLLVFVGQASMTYIFPLYFLAFTSLSSYAQSAFTFVLPFIKLGLKNHFGHTLRGIDDIKPAFIVFNVDVFCALFVANCLQRSQSWVNTLLIMIVDIFQICISLYDIHHVMSDIRSLVCLNMFDGSLLNLSRLHVLILCGHRAFPFDRLSFDRVSTASPPRHRSSTRLVQRIAKVLYIAEFVLLIEFTEVMIPIIYSMYLVAMSSLPNRSYYTQTADLDPAKLAHSISMVMANAGLEFLTFLVTSWIISRQLGLSSLHHLAFALEMQRVVIQSTLVLWIFYVIQQSLVHNGVAFAYGVSMALGFPVPFTLVIQSVAIMPTMIAGLYLLWRRTLRGNPSLQADLRRQTMAFLGQVGMIWVYPIYFFAFTSMPSLGQSVFTLVLPLIKLAFKNYFSHVLRQLDDIKPAFVVFNADVFSALYVANCLQTSQSLLNTLLVLVVDIVQMAIPMYDVHAVMLDIRSLVLFDQFDGTLLDLFVEMARSADVRKQLDRRSSSMKTHISRIHGAIDRRVVPPRNQVLHLSPLPVSHRTRLAAKISKVLYITEFVLLIEFVEVMIPVIYGSWQETPVEHGRSAIYEVKSSASRCVIIRAPRRLRRGLSLRVDSGLLTSTGSWLVRLWERFQVELHGSFSIQRVETIRAFIATTLTIVGPVQHFRCCLPSLNMSYTQIIIVSIVGQTAGTILAFGLSLVIGFPVPFTLLVQSTLVLPTLIASFYLLWRSALHGNKQLQTDLKHQIFVLVGLATMTYSYPVYFFVFTSLDSSQQSAFTFALPLIKLGFKNYFSRTLRQLDDLKPAFMVVNTDIFNALYVANCLQASQSRLNTMIIMCIDIVQMAISIYDVRVVMRDIRSILDRQRSSLKTTTVPTSLVFARLQGSMVLPIPENVVAGSPSVANVQEAVVVARLNSTRRVRLVHKITKVLYIAEFLLLIEFGEVIVPVIYSPETQQHHTHAVSARSCFAFVSHLWGRFQVELHGQFSIQRVERMHEYVLHTSRLRLLLLGMLTPVPALIVITLIDCFPLVSPDEGSNRNYAFWIRMTIVTTIIVGSNINHYRCCLPSLPMTNTELVLVAFGSSTLVSVSVVFGLSHAVGFPVPFAQHVQSIVGAPVAMLSVRYFWRSTVRGNPALGRSLVRLASANSGKFAMLWLYPLYLFAFTSMTSIQQSMFIFVLPIVKLTFKNYFRRVLRELDDCKPAFIVFNTDLFNALYLASCLQSSHSWLNTLLVLAVDVVQMALSMYDVRSVVREIHSIVHLDKFDGSLLDLCVAVSESSDVHKQPDNKPRPPSTMISSTIHPTGRQYKMTGPPASATYVALLPAADRGRLASLITNVLFIAEFFLLIEFVEVITPVIYVLYLGAMSHLPNRAYYPRLASLTEAELSHSMTTVVLNAGLELISFLVACRLLDAQLKTSSVRLLGFVLESQRSLVQTSLVLWTTYVTQMSLLHTGVDFTLRFSWLRAKDD